MGIVSLALTKFIRGFGYGYLRSTAASMLAPMMQAAIIKPAKVGYGVFRVSYSLVALLGCFFIVSVTCFFFVPILFFIPLSCFVSCRGIFCVFRVCFVYV